MVFYIEFCVLIYRSLCYKYYYYSHVSSDYQYSYYYIIYSQCTTNNR